MVFWIFKLIYHSDGKVFYRPYCQAHHSSRAPRSRRGLNFFGGFNVKY